MVCPVLIAFVQVAQHKTSGDRIWVTYRNAVYDVTEFVENHPGGMKRIMLAGCRSRDDLFSHSDELSHRLLRCYIVTL
jgi:cytochrome b involved in lipid metabolism